MTTLMDMDDPEERRVHAIRVMASNLIRDAETLGVVVKIDLIPLEPLAMGNYQMAADVYPAQKHHIDQLKK